MTDTAKVGLVFVSHSTLIAEGLVELARQMAPHTALIPAGGTEGGGIGTSFERVLDAVTTADTGDGVVVLGDLGSAFLTAETARDFLDPEIAERVLIVDAPLVEGAVAAAVAAESGGDLAAVAAAARTAAGQPDGSAVPGLPAASAQQMPQISRTVVLINPEGLHARPAAEFVKLANTFPSAVTVNGVDAKSLLRIMALGLTKGASVEIASDDENGGDAVEALAQLVESGFGEA